MRAEYKFGKSKIGDFAPMKPNDIFTCSDCTRAQAQQPSAICGFLQILWLGVHTPGCILSQLTP
jgi:hypothetical protein